MRRALALALLFTAGCFSTTRYRAPDVDATDDDELDSIISCRETCEADASDDFIDCWSRCPSVKTERGECKNDGPLCYETRGYDPIATQGGVTTALLGGGMVLGVLTLLAAQDFGTSLGEAIGDSLFGSRDN